MKHILILLAVAIAAGGVYFYEDIITFSQSTLFTASVSNAPEDIKKLQSLNTTITTSPKKDEIKQAVTERKKLMLELAENDPAAFLNLVIPADKRNKLDEDVKKDIEREVSFNNAVVNVLHVDNFEHPEHSKNNYFIHDNGKNLSLNISNPPNIISGTKMNIKGYQIDSTVAANSGDTLTVQGGVPNGLGVKKTAVLLVSFLDSPAPPFSKDTARSMVFSSDRQFVPFFKENSYGKVSFSGEVYGWHTIPRNGQDACSGSKITDNITEGDIDRIGRQYGVSFSSYDEIVIFFNRRTCAQYEHSYGTIGKWSVAFPEYKAQWAIAWVNAWVSRTTNISSFHWSNFDRTLSHEVGHNLGLPHANGIDCGTKSVPGANTTCSYVSYGNYYDTMGQGKYAAHFNSRYKEYIGWTPPASTKTITSSGTYRLYPLEQSPTGRITTAKIYNSKGVMVYYLEYRKPIGYDRLLTGVSTAVASNQKGLMALYKSDFYVDLKPTSESWQNDIMNSSLNLGNIPFYDTANGITIGPVRAVTDSYIEFEVKVGTAQ
ncbi:MAG: hypothetical protein M3Q73_03320 [bacterium]|nr:hypothetical protein [bacterium]